MRERLEKILCKTIAQSTDAELYDALLQLSKEMAAEKRTNAGKKKIYYVSAEFLIGKLLSNNLINLGIDKEVRALLEENGKSLANIEEIENEPSLGNGGLGRLAACFLDSIATLGLNGDGCGINYHLGLFKQVFDHNLQKETPNPWLTEKSWLTRTDVCYPVSFGGFGVMARMYDLDVVGYNNRTTKLHLFDIDTVDEGMVHDGISFEKWDVCRNLTLFLYPDDSDEQGRMLRVYQQYFMVSAVAQLIVDEALQKGSTLHDLPDYAVVQINDTHPSMVIPELIRVLGEHGIGFDEAVGIVSRMCAYTNHTILAEALEKWPVHFIERVAPRIMPIIWDLDNRVKQRVNDESTGIIRNGLVHMAHMDIHYGFSVNGVARLHTEILKKTELNNFYRLYPEKFTNKTNGITFRRWLMSCNPELSELITSLIGDSWKKNAYELEKLEAFAQDEAVLEKLLEVKRVKKQQLADYLKATQGIEINADSLFDIQTKRLHEYKRQQLNALYVIDKYLQIKAGYKPAVPVTVLFGAKAAPAYVIAKDIIHMILCLQQVINNDPEVSPWLKVVMPENYNVSLAEKVIPACDISEQISLASKEASGTGNMKFMLNGAVTLGTLDGANVEIGELVGEENIYIFGDESDIVIARYARGDYNAYSYYSSNARLRCAVDFIISDRMMAVGNAENLRRLHHELTTKDWFMTFPDFESYRQERDRAYTDYTDRMAWAAKMLRNISNAGYFSSDRTIAQYNKDIWKLN
ncbi:MAG: glycogen/starch/alpha-glucan family phosphorylase [Clostridia bacterium]|nr:glycogen/starch/alpha-glucan family phosphorylase [Clostridia bacterium]